MGDEGAPQQQPADVPPGGERPKDIDEQTYRKGIAQANPSQPSTSSAAEDVKRGDTLKPVSALGAFPLVIPASTSPGLASLVKGAYRQMGAYAVAWAGVTLALLPTIRGVLVVGSGSLLFSVLLHHNIRKLKSHQEDEEAARFDARSNAIQEAQLPESVEWLNALIEGIWPRIPAEMFSSVADMLEDVIQANLPSFVSEVKCAELTQGKNPLRVLSSRLLPPTEEDEEEAMWNGGVKKHIQLEIAFAYRAREKRKGLVSSTKENSRKIQSNGDLSETTTQGRQDARILFLFQAKIGPTAVTLPVKVLLNGLVGIARIRLEATNSSPFLGEMDVSFVGLPRVSLDIVPLKLSLAEVPGLSGIIQQSVDSALEMYTMPKKLNLNLGELIVGDGIKRKCDAKGVVIVTVHSAKGLERSDIHGLSDPYVRVGWSRTGMASTRVTRVIKSDLNPIWEQTFALVVSPQVLAALTSTATGQDGGKGESISLDVYDSDTSSDDDFLGRARCSLRDIIQKEASGKMQKREDNLIGKRDKEHRGGSVTWSVGYFPTQPLKDTSVKGKGENVGKMSEEDKTVELTQALEQKPPPSSPSLGILSIQIHGIASLRFRDSSAEEAFEEAPSSYVEVLLADRRVFKSRTKMDDGEPCFNAVTEQVCDWKTSNCVLVVRENKVAGKDAILGIVPIQLSQVFQKSSLVTDVYPLAGGIGSGRMRVSLLFTALDLPTSAPRLQTPMGVLAVHSVAIKTASKENLDDLHDCSVEMDTMSAKAHLSQQRCKRTGESSAEWQISGRALLPIYRREAIALIVKIRAKKGMMSKKRSSAIAVLWLNQLEDKRGEEEDTTRTIELGLWDARQDKEKRKRLERNWASIDERDESKIGLKLRGTMQIRVDFYTGVTHLHSKASQLAGDASKVYEAWRALEDAGFGGKSKVFDNIPDNPDDIEGGDSSSSSSDSEGEDGALQKGLPLQKSGSKSQLLNRLIRRGDHEGHTLKHDIKDNFTQMRNRLRTDNDKSTGVETEV